MKKLLFFLMLVAGPAYAGTIPITGNLRLPNGNAFNGNIRFTLSYSAGTDICSNNIVVAQSMTFRVQNGVLPSSARITGNDCIAPANTTYTVEYFTPSGTKTAQNNFYVAGSQFNLSTATPTPITTSNISFDLAPFVTATTKDCSKMTGNGASAKIQQCFASTPAAGVSDARALTGAQAITSPITATTPVTLLLGPAAYTCQVATCFSGPVSIECSGTTITSTIANTGLVPSSDIHVRGCTFIGNNVNNNNSWAINAGNSNNVEIRGNTFRQWGAGCVNMGGNSTNWTVIENTFDTCVQDGVFVTSTTTNAGIHNNVFLSSGNNDIDVNGVGVTISGNRHYNSGTVGGGSDCYGILVVPLTPTIGNVTITNEYFSGPVCGAINLKAGFMPNTARLISVTNSVIDAPAPGDCILVDGSLNGGVRSVVIANNVCHIPGRYGILVDGSIGTISHVLIHDNYIDGATNTGILVTGANATDVTVFNNDLSLGNATPINVTATTTAFGNKVAAGDPWFYGNPGMTLGLSAGATQTHFGLLDVRLAAQNGQDGIFLGTNTGWVFTENADASLAIKETTVGVINPNDRLTVGINTNGVGVPQGLTIGTGGIQIKRMLGGSASLTFAGGGAIGANTCNEQSITITGAASGDVAKVGVPAAAATSGLFFAVRADTNVGIVNMCNVTAAPIANPGAATFRVVIEQY